MNEYSRGRFGAGGAAMILHRPRPRRRQEVSGPFSRQRRWSLRDEALGLIRSDRISKRYMKRSEEFLSEMTSISDHDAKKSALISFLLFPSLAPCL